MELLEIPQVGDIVIIKRDDRDGDRIPRAYRMYIGENTYIYKARIIKLLEHKSYNRVQPLPLSSDTTSARIITRKGYKTKIYKLPL